MGRKQGQMRKPKVARPVPSLADERRRLIAAQARRTELRNAKDWGELLEVAAVCEAPGARSSVSSGLDY
jgi:phage terminase Nu1 subunit (DNA packaging protein)